MKNIHISVGICTKDRKEKFFLCLSALKKQSEYITEIIVIEDTSEQNPIYCSQEKLKNIFPKTDIQYKKVSFSNISKSRNLIKRMCKKDVLIYIDDDVISGETSIQKMKQLFEKNKDIDVLTGKLLPYKKNYVSTVDSIYYNQTRLNTHILSKVNSVPFSFIGLRTKNKIIKKTFFNEEFIIGEDIDFTITVHEQGANVFFSPEVVNLHFFNDKAIDFIKKKYLHGRYIYHLKYKYLNIAPISDYSPNILVWPKICFKTMKYYHYIDTNLSLKGFILTSLGEIASLLSYTQEFYMQTFLGTKRMLPFKSHIF